MTATGPSGQTPDSPVQAQPRDRTLPCGCEMKFRVEDELNVFVFEACSPDCEAVAHVISEAQRLNKLVAVLV